MEVSFTDCESHDIILVEWNKEENKIHKSFSDSCLNLRKNLLKGEIKKRHFESCDVEGKGSEEEENDRLLKRARIECEMQLVQHQKRIDRQTDRQSELMNNNNVNLCRLGRCYRFFTSLTDWYENDVNKILFWAGFTYTVVRLGEYL